MLVLKIVIGVLALGLGIWLGLPGRYEQTLEDIEYNLDHGDGRSHKVKRYFTPLAWLQRNIKVGSSRRPRNTRRPFQMEAPDDPRDRKK